VGTDFICTLFREEQKHKPVQLFPTSSFAIQIKTGNPTIVDASKHLHYLRGLELPFFVGFVDQEALSLRIFSCHHLAALFSGTGTRLEKLTLVPTETLNRDQIFNDLQTATSNPDLPAELRMFHVATLAAHESVAERQKAAQQIAGQCSKTLRDISARISQEYYFTLDDQVYWVLAGIGSVHTYRLNLIKRLVEAFTNLEWGLANGVSRDIVHKEFSVYETLYSDLKKLKVVEISLAEPAYQKLAERLGQLSDAETIPRASQGV
jgi:hypothetical protein